MEFETDRPCAPFTIDVIEKVYKMLENLRINTTKSDDTSMEQVPNHLYFTVKYIYKIKHKQVFFWK